MSIRMDINGYPNYIIYDDGRIFSKKRKKYMKPVPTPKGYRQVSLCNNGTLKTFRIHRLVAQHYLPNPENYDQIDHIDRDRANNAVANLRWCDNSDNSNHRCVSKNNSLGCKNIYAYSGGYRFEKTYKGVIYTKQVKTLEEAIDYKRDFYSKLDDKYCLI